MRRQVTCLEASKHAPALVFQIEATARGVNTAIGAGNSPDTRRGGALAAPPRQYFAPRALAYAHRDASWFPNVRESTHPKGEFSVKSDLLLRKAEESVRQRVTIPDAPVVILCAQSANLSDHGESLVFATTHGNLAITKIAQQTGSPSGPIAAPWRKGGLLVHNDD